MKMEISAEILELDFLLTIGLESIRRFCNLLCPIPNPLPAYISCRPLAEFYFFFFQKNIFHCCICILL